MNISAEMSALLDHLLNSAHAVSVMSAGEVEGYADRNHRLRQLSKQLNELPNEKR